jgi:hypothetical protein
VEGARTRFLLRLFLGVVGGARVAVGVHRVLVLRLARVDVHVRPRRAVAPAEVQSRALFERERRAEEREDAAGQDRAAPRARHAPRELVERAE